MAVLVLLECYIFLTVLHHGDCHTNSSHGTQDVHNMLIPNLVFNHQSHASKFHFRDNVCNVSTFQNTNCITASLPFHIAFRFHFVV